MEVPAFNSCRPTIWPSAVFGNQPPAFTICTANFFVRSSSSVFTGVYFLCKLLRRFSTPLLLQRGRRLLFPLSAFRFPLFQRPVQTRPARSATIHPRREIHRPSC